MKAFLAASCLFVLECGGHATALRAPIGTESGGMAPMLSPHAFGHTGFTGTSIWIDPEPEKIMVLLTNRVHPCANQLAMQQIRGEFHRLALGRS